MWVAAKADYLLAVPLRDVLSLVTSWFEARRVIEPARKFRRNRAYHRQPAIGGFANGRPLKAAIFYQVISCQPRLFRQSLSTLRSRRISENKEQTSGYQDDGREHRKEFSVSSQILLLHHYPL